MRIGSLCSGYGGLCELAVAPLLGGTVVWHAETDKDAAAILEHRWPDIPNHGDLTTLAWAEHPVDVLAAGFPCQPVSGAGKRKGVNDKRWLFDDIVAGIGRMDPRPGLLVFENVLGLLSANGGDAMARVVQGLASVGYMGRWRIVRAADAGAPHGRARIFIVATDTYQPGLERAEPAWGHLVPAGGAPWDAHQQGPRDRRARQNGGSVAVRASDPAADARGGSFPRTSAAGDGLLVAAERGALAAADARRAGDQPHAGAVPGDDRRPRQGSRQLTGCGGEVAWGAYEPAIRRGGLDGVSAEAIVRAVLGDGEQDGDLLALDWSAGEQVGSREVHGVRREEHEGTPLGLRGVGGTDPRRADPGSSVPGTGVRQSRAPGAGHAVGERASSERGQDGLPAGAPAGGVESLHESGRESGMSGVPERGQSQESRTEVNWGPYRPAIERWERLTRPAPAPTETGAKGQPRLSPRFVEWLMGLPDGHVTAVPGLSRNAQLKALGNGVVPQQAALALRYLLDRCEVAA